MNDHLSIRRPFITAWLCALAALLVSTASTRADDPAGKSHRMENRFLFVIDNASAMKSRAKGIGEAVNGLLESGMKGELRKGDTIGLWTYNDHLDTDFPMEVWSEEKKQSILDEVKQHVSDLTYEKRSHLEKAMPQIMHVVENSERVTVILIFDGSDPIKGTIFDKDINGLHKHYAAEFRSAHEPIVTVLAARHGGVFDYTINYPNTIMVPHTADPLPPPETNAPPPLVQAAPSPTSATAALPEYIVREPAPVDASQPHTNLQIVLSGSDFVHKPIAPPPAPANVEAVAVAEPAPTPAAVTNIPPPAEPAAVASQAAPTNEASSVASMTPPASVVTNPAPAAATPTTPGPAAPASPAVVAASGQLTAMFIIAFSLLTIAVVLVLFLLRRWRGPQPSLITETINRTR